MIAGGLGGEQLLLAAFSFCKQLADALLFLVG